MKLNHVLILVWNGGLIHELMTNDEHARHADEGTYCWVWVLTIVSLLSAIGYLLLQRHGYFAALNADSTPAPAYPLRRDLPRPTPPPVVISEVPSERYVFLATNDPNIDLQPKGRDHRG